MKIHVKYPREIDQVLYERGVHDVSDSLVNHWYFAALHKRGDIIILEEPAPAASDKKPQKKVLLRKAAPLDSKGH